MNKSWQLRALTAYLALGAPLGTSCAKEANTLEDLPEGNGGSSAGSVSKAGSTSKSGSPGAFGGTNSKAGSGGKTMMAEGGDAPIAEGGEGTGGSAGSGAGGTAGGGGSGGMVGVPPDVLERADVVLRSSTNEANASTSKIFAFMFLVNQSDDPLLLASVKVRYWFTSEAASPQLGAFHKGTNIASQTNTFVLDAARSHVLITFGGNSIAKGDEINKNEFQLQIEGGAQNQSNDWSFAPGYLNHDGHMPNDKITVYLGDKLIWGCEPVPGPCFDDEPGAGGAGGAH
jgi:hypothetical protein